MILICEVMEQLPKIKGSLGLVIMQKGKIFSNPLMVAEGML